VFVLCLPFLFSSSQLLLTSRVPELCLFLHLSEMAEHLPLFIKKFFTNVFIFCIGALCDSVKEMGQLLQFAWRYMLWC
jgi:hypothetical protein